MHSAPVSLGLEALFVTDHCARCRVGPPSFPSLRPSGQALGSGHGGLPGRGWGHRFWPGSCYPPVEPLCSLNGDGFWPIPPPIQPFALEKGEMSSDLLLRAKGGSCCAHPQELSGAWRGAARALRVPFDLYSFDLTPVFGICPSHSCPRCGPKAELSGCREGGQASYTCFYQSSAFTCFMYIEFCLRFHWERILL